MDIPKPAPLRERDITRQIARDLVPAPVRKR